MLRADLVKLSASVVEVPVEESSTATNGSEGSVNLQLSKSQYSNGWINYMCFARRAQGHKMYSNTFGKARKEEHIGCEVYKAAGALSVPSS